MAKREEIKMRTCKETDVRCQVCGCTKQNCLDMFEISFPGRPANTLIRLCDLCNDALLHKTLRASCHTQGRLKSQQDLAIIQKRRQF